MRTCRRILARLRAAVAPATGRRVSKRTVLLVLSALFLLLLVAGWLAGR
ncbi:hypothetical protein [Halolamina sp. C58]